MTLSVILLIIAAVLMALASFGVPATGKPNLYYLGWSLVVVAAAVGGTALRVS